MAAHISVEDLREFLLDRVSSDMRTYMDFLNSKEQDEYRDHLLSMAAQDYNFCEDQVGKLTDGNQALILQEIKNYKANAYSTTRNYTERYLMRDGRKGLQIIDLILQIIAVWSNGYLVDLKSTWDDSYENMITLLTEYETTKDDISIQNSYHAIIQEYERRKSQINGNHIVVEDMMHTVRFTKYGIHTFVRIISPRNLDANDTGNWIANIYQLGHNYSLAISMPLIATDIDSIIQTVHALFTADPGPFSGSHANPWTAIARLTSAVEQLSTYKK